MTKKIIFIGAGDLASRALAELGGWPNPPHCFGVARSPKQLPFGTLLCGDIQGPLLLQQLQQLAPDLLVITLVPNGTGRQGYEQGYYQPVQALITAFAGAPKVPSVIFVSSSGVYHQADGSWVDEASPTLPGSYTGAVLLATEQLLAASELPTCALRLSGIYGPGRDFLVRQVMAGQGGGDEFTNRIHQEDAARCLVFLIQHWLQDHQLPPILLASDSDPAPAHSVRTYIAELLKRNAGELQPSETGRGGNKRCNNARLRALGFEFRHPSYREGYKYVEESGAGEGS